VEEGIVPGGGVALLKCVKGIDGLKLEGDEAIGAGIVKRALESPIRQIAENAGVDGAVVCEKVRGMKYGEGYDALTGEYCNLLERGIVDPVKVARTALENAASIAGLLLTTEALVSEIPEEKEEPAPGGGGGMGGMY
ncbi:MAG TPA: molecular chaperone GroEL, partial [Planctomycetes bacterium]|nr:molecular chaperone GroEL [Planctomycetota bacterium]